jgi:hypothetical protein
VRLAAVLLVCAASMGCNAAHDAADANDGPDGGACLHASDCPSPTVCVGARCVAARPCISSRTCPGLVCDTTHGVCADCNAPTDCGTDGAQCEDHVCTSASGCVSDGDCDGGLHCATTSGLCVPCNRSADCDAADFCNGMHDCVPDVCVADSVTCVGAGTATCHADGSGLNAPVHCATGACADGRCVAAFDAGLDGAIDASVARDAGTDAAMDTGPLTCRGGTLGGIGIPVGTIVTTSGDAMPAPRAIDGDLTTEWSSGDLGGWIHLSLPFDLPLQGVAIAAGSQGAPTNETYTATNGSGVQLGSSSFPVNPVPAGGAAPRSGAIAFPLTAVRELTVTVTSPSAIVAIYELSLVSENCP